MLGAMWNYRCWLLVVWLAAALTACGGRAHRPTVTGGALYARVGVLQQTGATTIGDVTVRKDQALATASQQFLVAQLVEGCKGGDPATDTDCALALLVTENFEVLDHLRQGKQRKEPGEDRSRSAISSAVVLGLAAAATVGLVYGVATCEFEGCEAVFGVPLVLVGGALLFLLL
jgi:hypothetical protein